MSMANTRCNPIMVRRRFRLALTGAFLLALAGIDAHAQSDNADPETPRLQTVPILGAPSQPGQADLPRLRTLPGQVIRPSPSSSETTVTPGTRSATPIEIPRLETLPRLQTRPVDNLRLDTSALNRGTASAVLASGAVQDIGALIQQVSTPAGLASLSKQAAVGREDLLYLAHELQLKQAIGPGNIGDAELRLLDTMGVDSSAGLARFRGSEERLAEALARLADLQGVSPPPRERVASWVRNAAAIPDRIPPTPELIPAATSAVTSAEIVALAKVPSLAPLAVTAMLGGERKFSIPQGERELTHDFVATQPGLYRGEIQFDRRGGLATLGWQIERPNLVLHFDDGKQLQLERPSLLGSQPVKTTIAGYQRLIGPGTPLPQIRRNEFYFWVKPADLPLNQRLRLRLSVLKNQPHAPAGGGIEQDPTGGPVQSAPIEGTVSVRWQAPIAVPDFDEDVTVSLGGEPGALQVIETPVFGLVPEKHQEDYDLSFMFEPAGAQRPELLGADWKQQEAWKHKAQPPKRHLWSRIHVLHDNQPVAGRFGNGVTADYVVVDSPPLGVYRALAMAGDEPGFTQLMTRGYVVDSYQNPSGLGSFTASVRLGGGRRPSMTYVAELEALEVSDQAEPDDDDNDEGYGEFKVVATTTLSRRGQDTGDSSHAVTAVYPDYAPFMGPRHVNIPPVGPGQRNIVFPRVPLASFSKEQLDAYDDWATMIAVVEDDSHTWWQEHKQLFEAVLGWATLAWDFVSLDIVGAIQTVAFDLSQSLRSVGLDDVDDQMGYPNFSVARDRDYGFLGESDYLLELEGSSDNAKMGSRRVSGPAAATSGPVRAIVSVNSGDKRWARAQVRLRKRLALDSWMDIRLVSFKLNRNVPVPDAGPVNVSIRSGKPVYDSTRRKGVWEAPVVVKAMPGQVTAVGDTRPPTLADVESVASLKQGKSGLYAARYAQFEFWRRRPGDDDQFLGFVSNAFYAEDFLRFADRPPSTVVNRYKGEAYSNGRMSVSYRHTGPFYIGEFVIQNPSPWLEEVTLVAYTHIRE